MSILAMIAMTTMVFANIKGSRFKITESDKEFDIIYLVTSDMEVLENKDTDDVYTSKTFKLTKNDLEGELRYSLFTDTGGSQTDLKLQFSMWVFMCLNNIAGYEVPSSAISTFNDDDVKDEFNGDFGCMAFLQNPTSQYADGYKYLMAEFFCKENQGIVMRTYLFRDFDFVGVNQDGSISPSSGVFTNYHTFRFMDKDENGEYIREASLVSESEKARLLALIEEFRNDTDCAKEFLPTKYAYILTFALDSPAVHVVIDNNCYPEEVAESKYSEILLLGFIAGNVEHQLKTGEAKDASDEGMAFQLLKYKQLKKQDKKLKIKYLEKKMKEYKIK
mgnify:CR=1 FL=1